MSLNTEQIEQQIAHMIKFIESEADEKVTEIKVKAKEEFDREVARIVKEEERKIISQYERKEKNLETQKRIEYSNKLNAARVKVLQAQDEYLQKIVSDAKDKVKDLAADKDQYKVLLRDLIIQSLCSLLETEVDLRCRKKDLSLVKEVLSEAVNTFKEKTNLDCKINVDEKNLLDDDCGGGIELTVRGDTKVSNTLDKRMEMAVSKLMPAIRYKLFGASQTRTHFD